MEQHQSGLRPKLPQLQKDVSRKSRRFSKISEIQSPLEPPMIKKQQIQGSPQRKEVFPVENNGEEIENQDCKARENKKISIEDMNRNKRFLEKYMESIYKVGEEVEESGSQTDEDNNENKVSISNQIEQVSRQPIKRSNLKISNTEVLTVDQKPKKIGIMGKLKSGIRKSQDQVDIVKKNPMERRNEKKYSMIKARSRKSIDLGKTFQVDDENELFEQLFMVIHNQSSYTLIIAPDSQFRITVDFISFLIILYIAVQVPLMLSFFNEFDSSCFLFLDIIIDCWFILEILLNFLTAYFDRGHLIMNKKQIAKQYLQTWFLPDFISSFPFSLTNLLTDSNAHFAEKSTKIFRVIKLVKYMRFVRIMKFAKAHRIVQTIEVQFSTEYSNFAAKLLKLFSLIFLLSHWLACIFYGIGIMEKTTTGQGWIMSNQFQDGSVFESYVNTLYWSITTMTTVGMGDISPTTTTERITGIVTVILSSCIFGFIIQDIGKMVSNFNLLANQFKERIMYVEQFMQNKGLPTALRYQVRRYLEYCMELKTVEKIEEEDLMGLLNDDLKCKLQVYLYGGIISRIKLINSLSPELLCSLTFILQKQAYTDHEDLFVEGDRGRQIFYISEGKVAIVHKKSRTFIKDLIKKQYFGEVAFFTDLPRQASAKARDFSELITLDRKAFIEIARTISPSSLITFQNICQEINYEERNFQSLQLTCYLCEVVGHLSIDCKQFERTIARNLSKCFEEVKRKQSQKLDKKNSKKQDYQAMNSTKVQIQPDTQKKKDDLDKTANLDQFQQFQFENAEINGNFYLQVNCKEPFHTNLPKISPASIQGMTQVQKKDSVQSINQWQFRKLKNQATQQDVVQQEFHLEKIKGRKKASRPVNMLTRVVGQKKRFESIEKRKISQSEQEIKDSQHERIIRVTLTPKMEGVKASNVQKTERTVKQKTRNVFDPDYQDKEESNDAPIADQTCGTLQNPLKMFFSKMISARTEQERKNLVQNLDKNKVNDLSLIFKHKQQQKLDKEVSPNYFVQLTLRNKKIPQIKQSSSQNVQYNLAKIQGNKNVFLRSWVSSGLP